MKYLHLAFVLSVLTFSCSPPDQKQTPKVAVSNFELAQEQYLYLTDQIKEGQYPTTFDKHQVHTSNSGWWCSGFYPGTLWYIYEQTKNPEVFAAALKSLEDLEKEKDNTTTHDLGFMIYCSFGNAYRLTQNDHYKKVIHQAAKSLATRFDPKIGCIRSWDPAPWNDKWQFPVIIDNMMNLEMLMWAAEEFNDSTFAYIAKTHANTTLENHFREDFSSYHVISYDTLTGKVEKKNTAQGYADNSAWARGQAWGLYGYTVMYRFTKDPKYLAQAQGIADFIINHPNLPEDKIPYWDFDAPDIPNAKRDASAGAIMASALLELQQYVDNERSAEYQDIATKMLTSLSAEPYLAKAKEVGGFLLKHSVGHMPNGTEVDVPLSYADYYFVEAMKRYLELHPEDIKKKSTVFEVKNPDYELSPYTGMTKQHWYDAAQYLLEGAFAYVDDINDPMIFPKLIGKSYPHRVEQIPTEKLEGLSRTLFVAAPLLKKYPDLKLNNIEVGAYYRQQFRNLLDSTHESFIPKRKPNGGPSQILVEFGALSMSLFIAPEVLWDPLTQEEKDALAKTMLSYGVGPTVPSNWRFFNIFVMSFFREQGYPIDDALMKEYLEKSLAQYRADGWYNDSPAYDYYSMWAFQLYGIIWAEYFGKDYCPEIAAQFTQNFNDLNDNYPYLFSENGEMIMWGRSISYRIASISPLPFTGFNESVNHGWMRRISSGVLQQFLQNPNFLEDGVPTLGFYGQFEPAVQIYSCRGSVYWMGKAFFGLLVPDDNPFWTAKENNGPWETDFEKDKVYNKFQDISNLLITNYPGIGASEIRSWCHERVASDWQKFRSSENYNKRAYNSEFPWQADDKNGAVSMNYAFWNQYDQWEVFRLYTFKKFENGIYYRDAKLETDESITMNLADISIANGIIQIDRNNSTQPVNMRIGHYALPDLGNGIRNTKKTINGKQVQIIDNGTYQLAMVSLYGWETLGIIETENLHPVSEKSSVINASATFDPEASHLFGTLLLWKKSGEEFTDEELGYVQKIEATPTGATALLADGSSLEIQY